MIAAAPVAVVAPLPSDRLSHVEAEALIATIDARLLASNSATATLADWCGAHGLATEPRIRALPDRLAKVAPTPEQRARLMVGADEPVAYRRVQLVCGDHVLSEAENWFVPARLDPAMLRLLAETDTPFGAVIAPLKPQRRTMSTERLWRPLPEGWERGQGQRAAPKTCEAIPDALFRHHALVLDATGRPIAEVAETYQRGLLAFATPWSARSAAHCQPLPSRSSRP